MDSLHDESLVMKLMEKAARFKFGEVALIKFEQLAVKMGVDEKKLLELYIKTKNAAYRKKFIETPFSERIVLLPQCLRHKECTANRTDYGYQCVKCGKCAISSIMELTENLGYKGVYILSGGSVTKRILQKIKPKACLGVACLTELVLGSLMTEKMGIIVQAIKLIKDGCVETEVEWNTVLNSIKMSL